jgi:hypothetical protein
VLSAGGVGQKLVHATGYLVIAQPAASDGPATGADCVVGADIGVAPDDRCRRGERRPDSAQLPL